MKSIILQNKSDKDRGYEFDILKYKSLDIASELARIKYSLFSKIKVNEFPEEDINQLKLDLMDLIEKEYEDIGKNFKGYVRDKMVESMFADK